MNVIYEMSCHILQYSRAYCGHEFDGKSTPDENGVVHVYVEERIEMADCKECIREYHKSKLSELEDL